MHRCRYIEDITWVVIQYDILLNEFSKIDKNEPWIFLAILENEFNKIVYWMTTHVISSIYIINDVAGSVIKPLNKLRIQPV